MLFISHNRKAYYVKNRPTAYQDTNVLLSLGFGVDIYPFDLIFYKNSRNKVLESP